MPGPENDQLFSDHVAISHMTRQHQLAGIARRLPAVLIACMPRSASATLTHSLARLLDVPVLHTTIGQFPSYFFAPSWLDMYLEGGAVSQDHFMLEEFNLGVLRSRATRDIFVTIRDPRAAARSWVHWRLRWGNLGSASLEEQIQQQCSACFIPWLQNWIDRANDRTLPFRIHMIKFQDVVRNLPETARRIVRTLQDEFPAMASYANCGDLEEIRMHFNHGDDNAWRSEVGEATRRALWNACTSEIRELLQLEP
jgi:hypothetical protein